MAHTYSVLQNSLADLQMRQEMDTDHVDTAKTFHLIFFVLAGGLQGKTYFCH